jgi:hypothetical protein
MRNRCFLQNVTAKGLITVQILTYLLRVLLIRATVLPLFTTRSVYDHNSRILESEHHPFMSQYKHVVVSVYWSERVHEVTILSLQGRHADGPPLSIARVYEMARSLGGIDHWIVTGRGTLISCYKLQMRRTRRLNVMWAIVNIKSESTQTKRSSYTKSNNRSLTINTSYWDPGCLGCDFILKEAEVTVKTPLKLQHIEAKIKSLIITRVQRVHQTRLMCINNL